MMKRLITRVLAIGLVGSLMAFSIACSSSETVPDEQVTDDDLEAQEHSVVLYNHQFHPSSIEVTVGTTLIFENQDPEAHNIDIPALNIDQNVSPNEEWSMTLDTVGEFAVGNRFDEGMQLDLYVRD